MAAYAFSFGVELTINNIIAAYILPINSSLTSPSPALLGASLTSIAFTSIAFRSVGGALLHSQLWRTLKLACKVVVPHLLQGTRRAARC
jgi:hypothetical protein